MFELINVLLLVEDDENDIIITQRKIQKSKLPIRELLITKTLEETLLILASREIDVVLLDLNLPDSPGLETLDKVRATYQGIIIVLTSIDTEQTGLSAIDKGADDYIVKSDLNQDTLLRSVYYSIARRRRWQRVSSIKEKLDKLDDIVQIKK